MSRRLTILAGAGALVPEVIAGARAAGDTVQILPLVDRADLGLSEKFGVAELPKLIWRITSFRSTHVTMVGGLRASNAEREAFKRFARVGRATGTGDDVLHRVAEKVLAITGAKLVGPEALVPDLLARHGHIAGPVTPTGMLAVAEQALRAARAIGALDIGQAVIAAPGRIIATEDITGTDGLLARIAGYRTEGLGAEVPLVLAKALKPQQTRAIDRPAIGPDTVRNAANAGVSVIAVEAGGAILIDRRGIEDAARVADVSVVGLLF